MCCRTQWIEADLPAIRFGADHAQSRRPQSRADHVSEAPSPYGAGLRNARRFH
jgi:hypothetical protein